MRSEITDELFDKILEHFANNADNILDVLEKHNVTTYMFYTVINKDQVKSQRYAQARTLYVENRLAERDKLNRELLIKIQQCDPKIANALQNAYKEQIRQIEWDVAKLLPKKYGDKVDITTDGQSLVRNMTLTPIPSKSNSDIQLNNIDNSNGQ